MKLSDAFIRSARQFECAADCWDALIGGDILLYIAAHQSGEPGSDSRKLLVSTACECARISLEYIPKSDNRPINTIELAESWAEDKARVSLDDLQKAAAKAGDPELGAPAAYAAYTAYALKGHGAALAASAIVGHTAAIAYKSVGDHSDAAIVASRSIYVRAGEIVKKQYPTCPDLGVR
jgi:hypothetical protein